MTAPVRSYLLVWIGLIALLLLTLGSAYVPLGQLNVAINLTIAAAKALLVMIFFMHLRGSDRFTKILAAAGFVWLTTLLGLGLADFLTRS